MNKKSFLALATLLLAAPLAQGAVLMLDFGTTVVSGASQTSSPYHTVAGAGFTDPSWNQIQTADVTSLVYSDNSAATGLALNLGNTTGANTTLGLGNTPGNSAALGDSVTGGVYGGTSVGTDGIFHGSSGNTRAVGFQLTGLAAGTYEIYVTARNTSTAAANSQTVYVAGGTALAANGTFDFSGYTSQTISYTGSTDVNANWVETDNYLKFTLTLTAGQALNLAVIGGSGENRGFLNSVQIVAVPENSAGLLSLAAAGVLFSIRRRRR
jgi:MYXO-CTERM domain-containing protein